jgi:hypothetical protein
MKKPKNVAASVRERLSQIAARQKANFDAILVQFAVERLLARLEKSPYADRFVLKGAMLFAVWSKFDHRQTRDMDLLGFGSSDIEDIHKVFLDLLAMPAEDGLSFDTATLTVAPIRAVDSYGGLEVQCLAWLGSARITVHIDIGFGDVITPEADHVEFPNLLPDFPAPRIRAYPVYTAMAEKIEAAVRLGERNTRMKDFYDLWFMATKFDIDKKLLAKAVRATFERRGTPLPTATPYAFTKAFAEQKEQEWKRFLTRNNLPEPCGSLDGVIEKLSVALSGIVGGGDAA